MKKGDLMSKKITAIIPARGGSKGISGKNIKLLNGYPLIAYSIRSCKLSKNINRIIVSTENKEIASIAKEYGAEVPFIRPKKHSTDESTDEGFLNHFFDKIKVEEVALIRPTTPLRNPKIMDKAINLYFQKKEKISGLRSVETTSKTPYKLFQIIDGYCCGFFEDFKGIKDYANLPRQSFPKTYNANGHIDIVKKETLKKGTIFGNKIFAYINPPIIDIDSIQDFEYAEYQLKSQKQ